MQQSIGALLALYLVFGALPSPAQSLKAYVPVLRGTDADLGLALVNPTLLDTAVTITAHAYDGSVLQGAGLVNPVSLPLPALSQKALLAEEIFGQTIAGQPGWIELTLPAPAIRGFFLLFDSQLSFIDGTDLISNTSSRLLFPNASPSSIVSFVHTGTEQLSVSVALYDNDGNLFKSQQLSMAPLSGFSGTVDTLIPDIAGFEGYAVVDSSSSSANQSSLIGIESFRNKSDIAILKGSQKSDQLRSGYIAHLATQGQYTSTLTLVNPDPVAQRVVITADDLRVDGQPRIPASQTIERIIPPYGRLAESVDTLFSFTTQPLITGYIHYEVGTNTDGLIGYLAYGTTEGTAFTAASAQGKGYSDLFFAHLAQGFDYYTGLAILNPNADPAVISLNTFDAAGKQTGTKVLSLNPGEHRARVFSELLDHFEQLGGYARLSSNRPVFAYELFGSQSSLRFLADVPAQGVSLKSQYSGSVVTSTDGAQVLSMDGLTSLIVPPGALPADAAVEVATLIVEDLPQIPAGQLLMNNLTQNGGNEAPIGNVQLKPIDAQPKTPLPVIFPIRVQLKPGTQVPMFIYNVSTKQYARTNLFASVDESGRAVTAEITQLGTYVVGLSQDAILSAISVNPNTGVPGTTIDIRGCGFSPNSAEDAVTFAGRNNSSVAAKIIAAGPTLLTVSVPAGVATGSVIVTVGKQTSFGVPFVVDSNSPPPPVTQPLTVNAGPNQTITLPSSANLNGTASDASLPSGSTLTTTWSEVSGPGRVTFGNVNSLSTTASFSAGGTYVLQLAASDGALTSTSSVTITVNPQAGTNAQLLFKTGFEGTTRLGGLCENAPHSSYQTFSGTDTTTGFSWPLKVGNPLSNSTGIHTIPHPAASGPLANYFFNAIDSTQAHTGSSSLLLKLDGFPQYSCCAQDVFGTASLADNVTSQYIRMWVKLPPDLLTQIQTYKGLFFRVLFEFKTSTDYRIATEIYGDAYGVPYWFVHGDNNADGRTQPYQMFWAGANKTVPVPFNQWFLLEIYFKRSTGSDGRFFWAVNGQTIGDRFGPNYGSNNEKILGIFYQNVYQNWFPAYEWIDDFEIWDSPPCATLPCGAGP